MTAIPFPLNSAPGKTPHECAGRMINACWEPLQQTARAERAWRRAPGIVQFGTSGFTGHRGSLLVNSTLYSGFSGKVVSHTSAGGAGTLVGNLAGTKKLFWARNRKTPTPDVLVVDPDNGAFQVTSGSVTSFNAGGVLPAINSLCFLDGYFFFTTGDGRCFASALNDTTVNALTFISTESKPDGLIRAFAYTDLFLCGTDKIEVWHDTAEAAPGFPFSRLTIIRKGLLGPNTVSGFENGIDKGVIFASSDHKVYALDGYTPREISTPDVVRAIESYIAGGGDLNAIEMFPYVIGPHSCVVLQSPAWTWVFDIDNPQWFERQSYQAVCWRATGAYKAFDKWIAGDNKTGNLVTITESALDEVGDPLAFIVESGPVQDFPNQMAVMQATFDMAQGVGIATGVDPVQTDPVVEISHTDDGLVWSPSRIRKLQRQSEAPKPIKLTKCGSTGIEGRRWRIRSTAAVPVVLTGGDQSQELRAI
jgi:hypothetical protein